MPSPPTAPILNTRRPEAARPRPDRFAAPAVVSLSRAYAGPETSLERLAERLAPVLQTAAAMAVQAGGFVGHVKALAALEGGGSAALSLIRETVRTRLTPRPDGAPPANNFNLSLTAIIYGLSEDELAACLDRQLNHTFGPPPAPA